MFGYVRPFKPELKINEFDTYKGMYCGLCKQLGRDYGLLARMTLSYDFAFLAMLSMGTHGERVQFKRETCIAHPFTKRPCMCANDDLSYVAACAMMMLYYKWKDNIADSGFSNAAVTGCLVLRSVVPIKRRSNGILSWTQLCRIHWPGSSRLKQPPAARWIWRQSPHRGRWRLFLSSWQREKRKKKCCIGLVFCLDAGFI